MKDQRSLNYRKAIHESEQKLFTLERSQTKALLRDRMRFLRLLKSGECTSQAQAGRIIGLKLRASEKLWRNYREEGVEGLLTYPYRGKPEKIPEEVKQELRQELATDQIQGLQQVQHFIEEKSGVPYTIPGIHYVLERMQVKKKTGRPVYHDKDKKGEQHFKKKSSPS